MINIRPDAFAYLMEKGIDRIRDGFKEIEIMKNGIVDREDRDKAAVKVHEGLYGLSSLQGILYFARSECFCLEDDDEPIGETGKSLCEQLEAKGLLEGGIEPKTTGGTPTSLAHDLMRASLLQNELEQKEAQARENQKQGLQKIIDRVLEETRQLVDRESVIIVGDKVYEYIKEAFGVASPSNQRIHDLLFAHVVHSANVPNLYAQVYVPLEAELENRKER